jgi:hypothetical protein
VARGQELLDGAVRGLKTILASRDDEAVALAQELGDEERRLCFRLLFFQSSVAEASSQVGI